MYSSAGPQEKPGFGVKVPAESNYRSAILRYFCPDAIAVINAILQNLAVLPHVYIAFATQQHQITVVTEVIVPLDCLLVGPVRPVLLHFLIRHTVQIGPEVDVSFIEPFVAGFLFEVPGWLGHEADNIHELCYVTDRSVAMTLELWVNLLLHFNFALVPKEDL